MGTGELNESKHINCGIFIYIHILKCVHVCMGTGELNESKHINKPVPGGTVIPQYPYIYINLINAHKTYDICILYLAKTSIWLLISARSFQWTIDSADPLTGA